ncbi:hypothetical protein [Erysipelothrix tonsillarum]|uniref:hypothetical protein n=1 Tax=Erysipelothrix tonsillarum TaxID=38402 RepID=UPI0039C7CE0D
MSTIINSNEYPITVRFSRVQDQIQWIAGKEEEAKQNIEYFDSIEDKSMRQYWQGQLTVASFLKNKMLEDFKKNS